MWTIAQIVLLIIIIVSIVIQIYWRQTGKSPIVEHLQVTKSAQNSSLIYCQKHPNKKNNYYKTENQDRNKNIVQIIKETYTYDCKDGKPINGKTTDLGKSTYEIKEINTSIPTEAKKRSDAYCQKHPNLKNNNSLTSVGSDLSPFLYDCQNGKTTNTRYTINVPIVEHLEPTISTNVPIRISPDAKNQTDAFCKSQPNSTNHSSSFQANFGSGSTEVPFKYDCRDGQTINTTFNVKVPTSQYY